LVNIVALAVAAPPSNMSASSPRLFLSSVACPAFDSVWGVKVSNYSPRKKADFRKRKPPRGEGRREKGGG
jgi:hypothetical protein